MLHWIETAVLALWAAGFAWFAIRAITARWEADRFDSSQPYGDR